MVWTSKSQVSFFFYPPRTSRIPSWLAGQPLNTPIRIPNSRMSSDMDRSAQLAAGLLAPGHNFGNFNSIGAYGGGCLRATDSTFMVFGGGGGDWSGNDIRGLKLESDSPFWTTIVPPSSTTLMWEVGVDAPGGGVTATAAQWKATGGYLKDGLTPNTGHSGRTPQFINRLNTFITFGKSQIAWWDGGNFGCVDSVCLNNGAYWNPRYTNPPIPGNSEFDSPYPHSSCKDITERCYVTGAADGNIYMWTPDWAGQIPANPNIPSGQWSLLCAGWGDNNICMAAAPDYILALDWNYPPPSLNSAKVIYTRPGNNVTASPPIPSFAQIANATITDPIGVLTGAANWALLPTMGFVWDQGLKAFLLYRDDGNLYKLTPTSTYPSAPTFTLSQIASGVPLSNSGGSNISNQIYGRMQYVPNLRGVVIMPWADVPCYFIKTVAG